MFMHEIAKTIQEIYKILGTTLVTRSMHSKN